MVHVAFHGKKIFFASNTKTLIEEHFINHPRYMTRPNLQLVSPNNYMDNNKDYLDYLSHFILAGKSEIDFYLDVLPHETMHLIGIHGGVIEEGITERRTREVCKKYNIQCAPVLHSKETKIVGFLDELLGKDTLNKIGFDQDPLRTDKLNSILSKKYGNRLVCELIQANNLYKVVYLRKYNNFLDRYKEYRKMDLSAVTQHLEALVKLKNDKER